MMHSQDALRDMEVPRGVDSKRVCLLDSLVCDGRLDMSEHLAGNHVPQALGDDNATFCSVDVFVAPVHLELGHWVRPGVAHLRRLCVLRGYSHRRLPWHTLDACSSSVRCRPYA